MTLLWLAAPFYGVIVLFVVALCRARDRKPSGWRNDRA